MRSANRAISSLIAGGALIATFGVANQAWALTSEEGTVLGDQGYYWQTGQESWIFPHSILNIDNRVMLQYVYSFVDASGAVIPSATALTYQGIMGNNLLSTDFYNVLPSQMGSGGGLVVETIDNLDVGMWFSDNYSPGLGGFVGRGVNSLAWGHGATTVNDLQAIDPYEVSGVGPAGSALDAGRKMDLFAAYALPDIGVEAGLHLWWGSASNTFFPDDSTGPVNIDENSNDTEPNPISTSSVEDVAESVYSLSDFGLGLGGAYTGLPGLRVDLGFDLNFLGVNWEPNGMGDYVDAGGMGLAINARAHYSLFHFFLFFAPVWSP